MENNREKRRARIRKIIKGSANRPRLVVHKSNRYIFCQAIDDTAGETLAVVSRQTDAERAGREIAAALLAKKIDRVVFDRAGFRYHGNVQKLAEAAKAGGLKF